MFFGDNVQDTRQLFYSSWQKYRLRQPLTPLEQQLVDVIIDHPEYHAMFEKEDKFIEQAWFPEMGQTNPFLHMGLHLAIRDQVATNSPSGFTKLFQQLLVKYQDKHQVEHNIMECLAESLWQAQQNGQAPDEKIYLNAVAHLLTV